MINRIHKEEFLESYRTFTGLQKISWQNILNDVKRVGLENRQAMKSPYKTQGCVMHLQWKLEEIEEDVKKDRTDYDYVEPQIITALKVEPVPAIIEKTLKVIEVPNIEVIWKPKRDIVDELIQAYPGITNDRKMIKRFNRVIKKWNKDHEPIEMKTECAIPSQEDKARILGNNDKWDGHEIPSTYDKDHFFEVMDILEKLNN